jgi:hypothetical protein
LETIEACFTGCPLLEINQIPSSVKTIDGNAFNTTCLTRVVLPANYKAYRPSTFFSSLLPSTAVFSEGHEVADLEGFGDTLIFGNRPVPPMTLVLPSTVKEIKCGYDEKNLYTGIDTMYFYGQTPPKVTSKREMFFKNIKTMYVPSSAVKAYEDAYFSIGNISVKALPGNRTDFSYWLQPVSFDKNAIIKEYKAAAAIGKKNAQERDKKAGEYLQKEANRIFGF